MLTESEALAILPLEVMKLELRIPASITEHDALIQRQIWDALNFATGATGRAADDPMPLRAAAIAIVRQLYGGAGVFERDASRRRPQETTDALHDRTD